MSLRSPSYVANRRERQGDIYRFRMYFVTLFPSTDFWKVALVDTMILGVA